MPLKTRDFIYMILREIVLPGIVAAVICLLLFGVVLMPCLLPSGSMENTMNTGSFIMATQFNKPM